jgi:hypothetical protein
MGRWGPVYAVHNNRAITLSQSPFQARSAAAASVLFMAVLRRIGVVFLELRYGWKEIATHPRINTDERHGDARARADQLPT